MGRFFAMIGFVAVLAAGAGFLAAVPAERTEAAPRTSTFIVPASDGYGIGECVSSGSSCGKVVADAWCEAQGFTASLSFGLSDPADVTASIPVKAAERPITITCG